MGRVELARLRAHGARERAAHVAEHLALHQVLGDGPAVDGDERAGLAVAALVDLARHELLAGARLAGDEHGHVHGRDAADLAIDLLHRVAGAHHAAVGLVCHGPDHLLVLGLELVEEEGLGEDHRGLGREDREDLEMFVLEQGDHPVVAHVEEAEELALVEQGHGHEGAELEVQHALGVSEVRVLEGVGDDEGRLCLDHALYDGVGELLDGVLDRLALDVSCRLHPGLVALHHDEESLVGAGHVDGHVHEAVEELGQIGLAHQHAREVAEPAQALELGLVVRGDHPAVGDLLLADLLDGHVRVEDVEAHLDVAHGDRVPVLEATLGLALLLVDDGRALVHGDDREVAAVEDHARVVRLALRATGHDDVVVD